jgi:hypothetical protein
LRTSIFLVFIGLLAGLMPVNSFPQNTSFDTENHPDIPNYAALDSWSALPFRNDVADVLPDGETWVGDSLKQIDVFYVHPTVYQRGPLWNAGLDMKKINRKVDKYPVRLQSSVFNASCRVYAPRYRQAIIKVFYQPSVDGDKALDFAYQDVKRAFIHFLDNYNNGRPFIIAGHSQGTHHTRRLLQEMVDTTDLKDRLVVAYIIGYTVNEGMYSNLKMCSKAEETGCLISWMSYKDGFIPDGDWHNTTQSVNPLTWTLDTNQVVKTDYESTVVFNPKKIRKRRISVRIKNIGGNVLWVETKAPWFRLVKNLHVADYGLFYMDIRKNVKTRVDVFLDRNR